MPKKTPFIRLLCAALALSVCVAIPGAAHSAFAYDTPDAGLLSQSEAAPPAGSEAEPREDSGPHDTQSGAQDSGGEQSDPRESDATGGQESVPDTDSGTDVPENSGLEPAPETSAGSSGAEDISGAQKQAAAPLPRDISPRLDDSDFPEAPAGSTIQALFPDPVLARYIAGQLGRSVSDTVTQDELNTIARVDVQSQGLRSTEGMQYLHRLNEIRISNNALTQAFPVPIINRVQERNIQIYTANNQNFTDDLLVLDNPTLAQLIAYVPPVLLQMRDYNNDGQPVGTWTILDRNNGVILTEDAYNGEELAGLALADHPAGRYTVVLTLSRSWMDLENSRYTFPIEYTGVQDGTLEGYVTAQDGSPVAGVTITVGPGGLTATTDAYGYYTIGLPAGSGYTVTASSPSYQTQTKPATITGGQTTRVDFTLVPSTGSLAGFVNNAFTGEAIEGATITLSTGQSTTTREDGSYSFANIPVGTYRVYATASGYNSLMRFGYVGANEVSRVDFLLDPAFATLQGYVYIAGTTTPIPNATVTLSAGYTVQTDANGFYSMVVQPGTWTATASATNYGSEQERVALPPAGTEEQDFYLTPDPGTLRVVVVDENGDALPGVTITLNDGHTATTGANGEYVFVLEPDDYTATGTLAGYISASGSGTVVSDTETVITLVLRRETGSLWGFVYVAGTTTPIPNATVTLSNGRQVTTDANGRYEFASVPTGDYTVVGSAANYGTDTRAAAVLPSTEVPGGTRVDLELSPNPGTLTVRVLYQNTGQPAGNVEVMLDDGHVGRTDTNGQVTFTLAPGTYTGTTAQRGYTGTEETRTFTAGGSADMTLYLIPNPGWLYGRVIDGETRLEIEGATITANDAARNSYTDDTDNSGEYTINSLHDGGYSVTATATGYQSASDTATIVPGEGTMENFILIRALGSITGTVTDENGNPVPNATIMVGDFPTQTDSDGRYFMTLPTGSYIVTASYPGDITQQKRGEILANNTTVVDFTLPPEPGTITGTVTDEEGNPLPGATITIGPGGQTTTTDENGQYTIELPPGDYTVTVELAGYESQTQNATVYPGDETDASFVLVSVPSSSSSSSSSPTTPGGDGSGPASGGGAASDNSPGAASGPAASGGRGTAQTGDSGIPGFLLIVTVAGLLGLCATVVMKSRYKQ